MGKEFALLLSNAVRSLLRSSATIGAPVATSNNSGSGSGGSGGAPMPLGADFAASPSPLQVNVSTSGVHAGGAPESVFTVRHVPRASLHDFTERIVDYMRADNEALICGVYYLLLLCGDNRAALLGEAASRRTAASSPRDSSASASGTATPTSSGSSSSSGSTPATSARSVLRPVALTMHNAHRLVFSAMLVAAKWRAEAPVPMDYYALVCGVPRSELVAMEFALLRLLDFNAHVSETAFHYAATYVLACTVRPAELLAAASAFREDGGRGGDAADGAETAAQTATAGASAVGRAAAKAATPAGWATAHVGSALPLGSCLAGPTFPFAPMSSCAAQYAASPFAAVASAMLTKMPMA